MELTRNLFTGQLTPSVVQTILLAAAGNLVPIFAMIGGTAAMGDPLTGGEPIPISDAIPNVEHKWYSTSLGARRTQVDNGGSAYDATTTTIVVDSSAIFVPNMIIRAEATGEHCIVLTVPNATSITVKRGYGTVAAAAGSFANNAFIRVVAIAQGEGADFIAGEYKSKTEVSNFCQIFQRSVELTGTMLRSGTMTDLEQAHQRMLAYRDFVEQVERAILFGQKSSTQTDAAGRVARTMAGFYAAVTTNVTNVAGTMTLAAFENALRPAYDSAPGVKTLYCGSTAISTIRDLYKTNVRYDAPSQQVGFKVGMIQTSYGLAQVVYHAGLSTPYAGDILVVDHSQTALKHLEGTSQAQQQGDHPKTGRMQLYTGTPVNSDRTQQTWFAEMTLEHGEETAHARLTGITGAA